MKATDCIRASLKMSEGLTMALITDLKDSPLATPTPEGGNHALWILGHLTYGEGMLTRGIMLGEDNPVAAWKELFDGGTEPVNDADHYPAFDELIAKFNEIRAGTMKFLDRLSDDDLDTPSKVCPPDFEDFFGTYGLCLTAAGLHCMHHRGQIADVRRALGRKPLMA